MDRKGSLKGGGVFHVVVMPDHAMLDKHNNPTRI